jgi:outer membrane protein assembly factor BamD (BamD/ComL family)
MRPLLALAIVAGTLCAGCGTVTPDSGEAARSVTAAAQKTVLAEADAKLAAADYSGAQTLYAEFASSHPDHADASRARALRVVLDRLLAAEGELARVKRSDEVPKLRRELSERQAEVERLKTETAKLRADMERLRDIDLQTLPGKAKK